MAPIRIDLATFTKRLADLGTRPRSLLPRKRRDLHILLRSIALFLDARTVYSEPEINAAISDWRRRVAPQFRVDHVRLRRSLVDHAYLLRTADGAAYTVGPGPSLDDIRFAPEVNDVHPVEVAAQRHAVIARERAAYLLRSEHDRPR
ncbi:MAG TPA: DUF2087 domain-containing protein [Dehalococcoidia bacterium]|nr:DUF2087 domain-containing protein [Dehalococcoidia bacterium]